ncbi:hypothetical protein C5167_024251 [Papaver somniferum]|uniref:Uncharacterized protein n=1 Tax=Papaver somniferum TaxID=3469 RepID=A0A4Y7JRA3_PAPSO|nr:hypothetical protein C5167_024251 [Papaver somniferum]
MLENLIHYLEMTKKALPFGTGLDSNTKSHGKYRKVKLHMKRNGDHEKTWTHAAVFEILKTQFGGEYNPEIFHRPSEDNPKNGAEDEDNMS